MHFLPVYTISKLVSEHGIKHAVICPGSRNAPLTISFARNKNLQCYSIPDERSAAFIALGMAQYLQQPVALVCTSGTAALNFAPAIAEAYYQQIPLLVITADRPPELIHQRDGQAINQTNLYQNFVKKSYQLLPENGIDAENYINRITNEAIHICTDSPYGPVHINVPIREPFYPSKNEEIELSKNCRTIKKYPLVKTLPKLEWTELVGIIQKCTKKLIIAGLQAPEINENVSTLIGQLDIPIIADITSNIHTSNTIGKVDIILANSNSSYFKELQPDLLITIGREVLSKNVKQFIKNNKPQYHIHIEDTYTIADTYLSITHLVPLSASVFFSELTNKTKIVADKTYLEAWQNKSIKANIVFNNFIKTVPYGELKAISMLIDTIDNESVLHFANSMPVRYASYKGAYQQMVFSNRGTSGIDGSNSTAVGSALVSGKTTYLFTGDISFLYDRNAFWHNYLPKNLRIIVSNNAGGGIFRIIDGAKEQPELDDFFETKQKYNAQFIAKEFDFEYYTCTNLAELDKNIPQFIQPTDKPKIIEIFSSSVDNALIFEQFKLAFKLGD